MSETQPQKDRLELAQRWADLVSKVLGAVALLAAGGWTYTNFTVERTHDPTMQIDIEPAVRHLRGDRVLMNVDVLLQNIGRVAITPRFPDEEIASDLGLEISIVEMDAMPSGTGSAETPWFDWTDGAGQPRSVLYKRNLLASNEDFKHRRYQLNPGVKYREPFACLVEANKLYAIRARFWTEEGSIADLVYIDTFVEHDAPVQELVGQSASKPIMEPTLEAEQVEQTSRGNLLRLK